MNYWWTADYHFGHTNIIKYCNRPFKTAEEMNETIIRKHNERVKPDDTVFFLGDFIFKGGVEGGTNHYSYFLKRLNGHFVFIKGNHDKNNSLNAIISGAYIHYGGKDMYMCHDPEKADPNMAINLCGHIHTLYKTKRINVKSLVVNCGVDMWGFYPISFEQIHKAITKFKSTYDFYIF